MPDTGADRSSSQPSPAFHTMALLAVLTGAIPLVVGLVWLTVWGNEATAWIGIAAGLLLLAIAGSIWRAALRRSRGSGKQSDPKNNWLNNNVNQLGRKHPLAAVLAIVALFAGAIALRVLT